MKKVKRKKSDCEKTRDNENDYGLYGVRFVECWNDFSKKYLVGREFISIPKYEEGWVCPKCGSVMSPTQPYCLFCCSCGNTPVSVEATWSNSNTNIQT